MDDQAWLAREFGCRLSSDSLLQQALTHRSAGRRNNERLEFLGDAVLGFVISEELYRRFPDADEGQLSRLRVSLVKGSALAKLARELDVGAHLRLGSGETSGGGRQRSSILADTLEALLGAVLLDQGVESAQAAVGRVFAERLQDLRLDAARKDPKTRLQEYLQARRRPLPDYQELSVSGADHARTFTVRCLLSDDGANAEGEGASRRAAEQAAAQALLVSMGET
ncbi:MAG: ribonuclease III [Pseudomonadota bacterium]